MLGERVSEPLLILPSAPSHEAAHEFIASRLVEVQQMLTRRLDVKLLPTALMPPEGSVYGTRTAKGNQLDPDFVMARQAINLGNCKS